MQDDRIHWNGQPVALVLAETQEQADYAQSLIRVTYEEQNPVIALAAAKATGATVNSLSRTTSRSLQRSSRSGPSSTR
jgi:CO/xanthine dehydrogenase Mo-binding subunit